MFRETFLVFLSLILTHENLPAAPTPPHQSRPIVDYGADMCGFNLNLYRGVNSERRIAPVKDFDGDGSLENEFVSGWQFSESEPLNFPYAPLVDLAQPNARLYGGLMVYAVNSDKRTISEGHFNANHGMRDDYNFMALGDNRPSKEDEAFAAYALWYWDKKDFLNFGDEAVVTFDDSSTLSVYVSRYWGGLKYGRWVVRDGDQFYVSEKTFGGINQMIDANTDWSKLPNKRPSDHWNARQKNPLVQFTHTLQPTQTRWAPYIPEGVPGKTAELEFDEGNAEFREHVFQDVTAVGHMVGRPLEPSVRAVTGGLSKFQPLAYKWYAFHCEAVIEGVADRSEVLELSPAPGRVLLAQTETTFAEYVKLWRHFVTSQYPLDLEGFNYTMQRDGSMGSMRLAAGLHRTDEPVADVTFVDAITFCNMLSEYENREPAYYSDPEFSRVYRRPVDRDDREKWGRQRGIFWKKDSKGYRLPTAAEFALAAGQAPEAAVEARTLPVRKMPISASGHYGLRGNVWEYVWNSPSNYIDPETHRFAVMGGGFDGAPTLSNASGFQLEPAKGHYAVGFRVARGAVKNPEVDNGGVPLALFATGERLKPDAPMTLSDLRRALERLVPLVSVEAGIMDESDYNPFAVKLKKQAIGRARNQKFLGSINQAELEEIEKANQVSFDRPAYPVHLGKTEIPFKAWSLLRYWAEANGYTFNYAGDMGSARYDIEKVHRYDPMHPVTHVSLFDALVWCNALSEVQGLEPVYLMRPPGGNQEVPYRHALQFRLEMFGGPLNITHPPEVREAYGRRARKEYHSGSMDLIFCDAARSGYRLPMMQEFDHILDPLKNPAALLEREWLQENSGGKAQVVGSKPANAFDLHDMQANVYEWSWDPQHGYVDFLGHYVLNGEGCFTVPAAAIEHLMRKNYGDASFVTRPYYGFRVLRR